jgi:hypothetical protein
MAVGEVDGEPVIIIPHRNTEGGPQKRVVRLDVTDRRITRIVDYLHLSVAPIGGYLCRSLHPPLIDSALERESRRG